MGGSTTWLKRLFRLSRSLTLELRLPLKFQEEQTSLIWDTWIWLMREQLTWGWRHIPSPSSLSPPGSFYVSGLLSHYPSLTLLVPPGGEPTAPHQTLQEVRRLGSPLCVSLNSVYTLLDHASPFSSVYLSKSLPLAWVWGKEGLLRLLENLIQFIDFFFFLVQLNQVRVFEMTVFCPENKHKENRQGKYTLIYLK